MCPSGAVIIAFSFGSFSIAFVRFGMFSLIKSSRGINKDWFCAISASLNAFDPKKASGRSPLAINTDFLSVQSEATKVSQLISMPASLAESSINPLWYSSPQSDHRTVVILKFV